MKQLSLLLIIPSLLLMFACGGNETDTEKLKAELKEELREEMKAETESGKEKTEKAVPEETNASSETKDNTQSGKYEVSKIKKGDVIEGLEVASIDYHPNQFFNITFKGVKQIGGDVLYNEFEDSWELSVDKDFMPKSKLVFNGSEYHLFKTVAVQNRNEFIKALGGESVEQAQSGQGVWATFNFKNIGVSQTVDKGRLEVAYADYTSGR